MYELFFSKKVRYFIKFMYLGMYKEYLLWLYVVLELIEGI